MVFIETVLFSNYLHNYLNDDEYRKLQSYLIEQPESGDLIIGTGGLRKLRWLLNGKGKRSGIRVIYYWRASEEQIYLFTLYAKNEMSDLSSADKKALKVMLEDCK